VVDIESNRIESNRIESNRITYVINPGACKNGTIAHVPSNVATPFSITNELFDLPPITGSTVCV
jgi:hypothetical protein